MNGNVLPVNLHILEAIHKASVFHQMLVGLYWPPAGFAFHCKESEYNYFVTMFHLSKICQMFISPILDGNFTYHIFLVFMLAGFQRRPFGLLTSF